MILFFPVGAMAASAAASVTTPGVALTGLDLVREALLEIGVLNPTQDVSGEDAEYGLSKLNRLFDQWNANKQTSFATGFTAYTLTASHNPHTIGPDGDFEVVIRPNAIDGANLVVGDTRYPIGIIAAQPYRSISDPETTSAYPCELYYENAVPEGKIWLYPVPSAAYQIELWTAGKLGALELTDQIVAPDGYRDAVILTLAESLVAPFRVQMPEGLKESARSARALIFNNNLIIPALCTRDSGMSGGGGWFNFQTGRNE